MAIHQQILPPASGVQHAHPLFEQAQTQLRLLDKGEIWPASRPLRAGVSSFGFGGINVHLTLEAVNQTRRTRLIGKEQQMLSSPQDCELFLLAAANVTALSQSIKQLNDIAIRLSLSELTDLASHLARQYQTAPVRSAVIAGSPEQLANNLCQLKQQLSQGKTHFIDLVAGVFLATELQAGRVCLLFPGQASPVRLTANAWGRRFDFIEQLYQRASLASAADLTATDIAQPAIITAEVAGIHVLSQISIHAQTAIGHSVGEFAALHWAGVLDETQLLTAIKVRSQAMARVTGETGMILSLATTAEQAAALCQQHTGVNIACFNAPQQTVVSGAVAAIQKLNQSSQRQGIKTVPLPFLMAFILR